MNFSFKIQKIRSLLKENNLSAFLFTSPANVFYLSGFKSSNAYIIITQEENLFITDARYFEKAKKELKDWDVILIESPFFKFLKKLFKKLHIKILGYEKDHITYEFKEKLRTRGIKLIGFSQFLKNLRLIKTPEEIKIIKEGIKKTDEAYRKILNLIKPELSELELRGYLVFEFFKLGASGESFPAIIATAENSAIPHWETSTQKIKNNAPLLIDMGLLWKGYCTDFTRTIFIGKPKKTFKKLYEIVKSAWFKGFEKAKEGNPVTLIDKTIRDYFKDKGVDKFFIHATGHGVGIEIHEPPKIYYDPFSKKKEEIIKNGMVFTIEPGLYFPDKFGIRLENIVIIENGRGEIYSEIPLDLQII